MVEETRTGTSAARPHVQKQNCPSTVWSGRLSDLGGVGEGAVDDKDGECAQERVEADLVEACVGVPGVDLACIGPDNTVACKPWRDRNKRLSIFRMHVWLAPGKSTPRKVCATRQEHPTLL